ncbi:hypothetical protein [Oryza sativa Japonica Group]|uniref:Uncharacterized protein n=2 Tax=Oryza sativa subsp. japonica TaxID=39947 RepID=Q5NAC2_ORYSJ|nr:hypothetical protein [Oryza sativa Japonica Group]BAD81584.1 hypothetical protein [Oryza sativa Japonica Group]
MDTAMEVVDATWAHELPITRLILVNLDMIGHKASIVQFHLEPGQLALAAASDSDRSKDKHEDQKTLRRLAQNREAARKSRLRKKALLNCILVLGFHYHFY